MNCGKFKGNILYYSEETNTIRSNNLSILMPKSYMRDLVVVEATKEDDKHFRDVLLREDFLGYLTTERGLVYFDRSSMLYTLMGREEEAAPVTFFLTLNNWSSNSVPELDSPKPTEGTAVVGYHISGSRFSAIYFYDDDELFTNRGEVIPVRVSGYPAYISINLLTELFKHYQRLGVRPKEIISTTEGVYVRMQGTFDYERSLIWN